MGNPLKDHLCQRCLQIIDREDNGDPARVAGNLASYIMVVHRHPEATPEMLGKDYWNDKGNCWDLPVCNDCNKSFLAFCLEEEKHPDYSYTTAILKWVEPINQRLYA